MGIPADVRTSTAAKLATITGLDQVYSARPGGIGAVPCAFVGDIRFDLRHDAGTRQWSGEADVVLVVGTFDNEEAADDADVLLTRVIDAFSDAPHVMGANTVSEPVRVRPVGIDGGNGVTYPAWVVTIGRFVFQEGR